MEVFDVVTVGDSFIDTFLSIESPTDACLYDEHTQKLILHAGAKILLDDAEFLLGGNATNVAIGLSRLGCKTALIAELGDDEFAGKIKKGIEQEKVSLEFTKVTQGAPSTFSVGIHIGSERTLFVRHVKREHKLSLDGFQTKWIYLTSMGEDWKDMYAKTLSYVKSTGVKLAFNPGTAQMKQGYESFKDVVEASDILFVNRDEAEEMLYGKLRTTEEKETADSLLFRLQRMGPKAIVFTDGLDGAFALDEKGIVMFQDVAPAKVHAGKTGAGDAFASGYMGALLGGKDMKESLLWGAVNSASVVEHIGATTNLLTKEQLEERIKTTIG